MGGKKIEEIEGVKQLRTGKGYVVPEGETEARRVFTGHDTNNYRICQYIKSVLVFRH